MASSQYNSVYDMYKGNANKNTNAPKANTPEPNEPDPNAPIYSMYGNNQFGSPMLPDQKPSFTSVYDIYGQGKMNDFSAGAGKTPASPLEKPIQNPVVGNPARPPVVSDPYIPADPAPPEDSGVEDSPYTPGGSSGGFGGGGAGQKPTPPGEPPPLDKAPEPPPAPAPSPSGGGGGGGGGGSGPKKGDGKGDGGGGTPMNNPSSPSGPFGAVGGRPVAGGTGAGAPLNEFVGEGPAGGIGSDIPGAPTDSPMTKEEALKNGYLDPVDGVSPEPLTTDWDPNAENWVTTWSDGYKTYLGGPGRQFKKDATSPADKSPRSQPQPEDPANNYDGAGDPNAKNYGQDLFGSGKGFGSGGAWV